MTLKMQLISLNSYSINNRHSYGKLLRCVYTFEKYNSDQNTKLLLMQDSDFYSYMKLSNIVVKTDVFTVNYVLFIRILDEIYLHYDKAFQLMKEREYLKAWSFLCEIEHLFRILSFNNLYSKDSCIEYIKRTVSLYMQLYPYIRFSSHEILVKKLICNICGCILKPSNLCSHINGKIYNGQICKHVARDFELIGIAIPTNPIDKNYPISLCVNYEKQSNEYKEYYKVLEYAIPNIPHKYHSWGFLTYITKEILPIYQDIHLTNQYPCSSSKIYQDCCYNTNNIYKKYLEFAFTRKDVLDITKKASSANIQAQ